MIDLFVANAVLDIVLTPGVIYAIAKCIRLNNEIDFYALQEEKQQEIGIYEYESYSDKVLIDYDNKMIKFADSFGIKHICFDSVYDMIFLRRGNIIVKYYGINNNHRHNILLENEDIIFGIKSKTIKNRNDELYERLSKIVKNNNQNPAKSVTSTPLQTTTSR